MKSDIQIAQETKLFPIGKIAAKLGLAKKDLELYGEYKAKVKPEAVEKFQKNKDGRLVLVTAMTPTPYGEGKTTTTVGLGQALSGLGKKAIICLREPSLGPVFGIKGGAAGGGRAQVLPMEDINLHFTGDIHAVGAANNLISAVIDNHLARNNKLQADPTNIFWHRSLDMNDRALRNIIVGLGGRANGIPRQDSFDITVASEIMAVLCLAENLTDLKRRIDRIIWGIDINGRPLRIKDLGVTGSVAALLADALKPNLVQTTENNPAFVHGGPFANIAHGCNSLISTRLALKLSDYVITEAGFGADLGAEKFFDIKCRTANLKPSAVVLVATIRALKHHGAGSLEAGLPNLGKHIENLRKFGLEPVVALNNFPLDRKEEITQVAKYCHALKASMAISQVWAKGGKGGIQLAQLVIKAAAKKNNFRYLYPATATLRQKIETIARQIYGAGKIEYTPQAQQQEQRLDSWKAGNALVCMAKTQASLSDNPALLGEPKNFTLTVRKLAFSAGAGFVVVFAGDIMTMPGLPEKPAAQAIKIDDDGRIKGLF